jgi:hypothetical protein
MKSGSVGRSLISVRTSESAAGCDFARIPWFARILGRILPLWLAFFAYRFGIFLLFFAVVGSAVWVGVDRIRGSVGVTRGSDAPGISPSVMGESSRGSSGGSSGGSLVTWGSSGGSGSGESLVGSDDVVPRPTATRGVVNSDDLRGD